MADEPDLSAGISSEWVTYLQQALAAQGYWSGGETGTFDDELTRAVIAYQTAVGVPADGTVRGDTWAMLVGAQGTAASGGMAGSTDSGAMDAAVGGATGAIDVSGAEQWFQQQWGAEVDRLRRMFVEHRYGCWCGPGHVCEEEQDPMDSCCHQHDLNYEAAGVTSDDPAAAGKVGMWTAQGLIRTVAADATLVACVTATEFDSHYYGPEAAAYRAAVQIIFGGRASLAAWLLANGFS